MNIKTMRRDDWSRVLEKTVIIKDLSCNGYTGKVALLKILKVSAPLFVNYGDVRVKIVDNNHTWLQIGLEGQFFWITAMFDENDRLLEIYIDITDGNQTTSDDPYFVDMYLDYVIHGDMVLELDRDELEDALSNADITQAQFERTLSEGEKLFSYLQTNKHELIDFVQRKFQELKNSGF